MLPRSVYREGGAEPTMHIPLARNRAALKALQRPEFKGLDALAGDPILSAFSICIAGLPPAHNIPLEVANFETWKFILRGVYIDAETSFRR